MKRSLVSITLLCLVASLALATGTNLLTNGDLSQCPCLEEVKNRSNDHTNVFKYPYQPGSTDLKGWTVTRDTVYLTFNKKHPDVRWLDLGGRGGIKQSFNCPSKSACVLRFNLVGNPQGPSEQAVSIEGPGVNVQETIQSKQKRQVEVQFVPSDSPASVEIYATTSGRGPRIYGLSVEAL